MVVYLYTVCGLTAVALMNVVCAGLGSAERSSVQHQWMDGQIPVIVATISFGMGVDKANVRSGLNHHAHPYTHVRVLSFLETHTTVIGSIIFHSV